MQFYYHVRLPFKTESSVVVYSYVVFGTELFIIYEILPSCTSENLADLPFSVSHKSYALLKLEHGCDVSSHAKSCDRF